MLLTRTADLRLLISSLSAVSAPVGRVSGMAAVGSQQAGVSSQQAPKTAPWRGYLETAAASDVVGASWVCHCRYVGLRTDFPVPPTFISAQLNCPSTTEKA